MFPLCIIVNKEAYTLIDTKQPVRNSRIRLYESNTDRIVGKSVRLNSGELYFHTNNEKQPHIFISPIRIIYHVDHAILVYPYAGLDAFELSRISFWTKSERATLTIMDNLVRQLVLFHQNFGMAMGDIKPSNIVYNSLTGIVSYIDLEYATAPRVFAPPTNKPTILSITIPNPRARHYRTTTTPEYSSLEKRCGYQYCVFKNDAYALATTMFCLLTNNNPPTTSRKITDDKESWILIHVQAFRHLVFCVHSVLRWSMVETWDVLDFIYTHWSLSGTPLFPT